MFTLHTHTSFGKLELLHAAIQLLDGKALNGDSLWLRFIYTERNAKVASLSDSLLGN